MFRMFRKTEKDPNQDTAQNKKSTDPEKLRYSHYYEHDGILRAYANRAMLLALISIPTALVAVALAAYVRLQPPTVIRVDQNGEATIVGRSPVSKLVVSVAQGADSAPSDFEKKAFLRSFLDHYLNFSPDSVDRNLADALNMMTSNLRVNAMKAMEKDDTVGKIQDDQTTSVFHLRSLEVAKDDPLTFTAFGVKDVHRVHDHRETTQELVGQYHLRLITERRSEQNPSGLLLAEYGENVIDGENRDPGAQ